MNTEEENEMISLMMALLAITTSRLTAFTDKKLKKDIINDSNLIKEENLLCLINAMNTLFGCLFFDTRTKSPFDGFEKHLTDFFTVTITTISPNFLATLN